jgi:hypothetical protein
VLCTIEVGVPDLVSKNCSPSTSSSLSPLIPTSSGSDSDPNIIRIRWPRRWLVLHREHQLTHSPPEISPVCFVFTQKSDEHAWVKPAEGRPSHPFAVERLELRSMVHIHIVEDQVVRDLKARSSPSRTQESPAGWRIALMAVARESSDDDKTTSLHWTRWRTPFEEVTASAGRDRR